MATVSAVMDLAKQKISENAADIRSLGAVYKFVLNGDGGGTFLLNLRDNPGVSEGDGPADCTITMSVDDFLEMVENRSDARQYFFMGKVGVQGDFGLAIKLRKLSDMFR